MVVAPLSVTLERDTIVDFTTPYYDYAGIQILMMKQETDHDLFRLVTHKNDYHIKGDYI